MGAIGQFDPDLVRLFDQSANLFCIAGNDGSFKLVNPAFVRVVSPPGHGTQITVDLPTEESAVPPASSD